MTQSQFIASAGDLTVTVNVLDPLDYQVVFKRGNSQPKIKRFKGESAWSNAQRYANDLMTNAGRFDFPFAL